MTIYFILIFCVIFIPIFSALFIKDSKNSKKVSLAILMFLLFLLFSLKSTSVGTDIIGYERMYDSFTNATWNNYDLYWTEWLYEFLEMIFTHILHVDFRTFLACIYAFLCYSYYRFIKNYSKDYQFSVLIYICFTFMIFDMSAIRNLLAVAICLFAFPYAEKKNDIKSTIIFFLLTMIATQVHSSAYIFLLVYFVIRYEINVKTSFFYIIVPFLLIMFKGKVFSFINSYIKPISDPGSLYFGGNLFFMILILSFTIIILLLLKKKKVDIKNNIQKEKSIIDINVSMRLLYVAIFIQLFASETILSRLSQFVQIFIIILLPNSVSLLDNRSKVIVKYLLYIFFIWYFWKFGLSTNSLDVVPYKFYWQ